MLQLQPPTIDDDKQFRRLCDTVYRHCGILLNDGKRELVHARVARQLRTRPNVSAGQYLDEVLANPRGPEFASLIDALSTNLTSFNREAAHFRYLTTTLLPKLLERKRRERSRSIRAWSSACSSGEEPYTLATTMADALRDGGRWDTLILATDISRSVLRTASTGRYPAERLKSLPPGTADRYFTRVPGEGDLRQVSPEIRAMIRFNYLNLMEPWPFVGPFDFIFCRNVMIYFDKPTQERLVSRFYNCLARGGVLFTGHSESLTGIKHKFSYAQPTIYIKD